MTSNVTVNAHTPSDVVVRVLVDANDGVENHILTDGQSKEFTIYDDRTLAIQETPLPIETSE